MEETAGRWAEPNLPLRCRYDWAMASRNAGVRESTAVRHQCFTARTDAPGNPARSTARVLADNLVVESAKARHRYFWHAVCFLLTIFLVFLPKPLILNAQPLAISLVFRKVPIPRRHDLAERTRVVAARMYGSPRA